MEENYDNNEEQNRTEHDNNHDRNTSTCWVKYLVISLAAFFGAFLAVYFIADQAVNRYMMPPGHPLFMPMPRMLSEREVQRMIKHQEKMQERMFYDLEKAENVRDPFVVNPVKIDTFKNKNSYIIMIDLKPFNNDPNKVKIDIKPYKIKLSGESDEVKKGTENEVSFMQNFSLPQKIDVDDVKKEVKGNKYIITLPIDD